MQKQRCGLYGCRSAGSGNFSPGARVRVLVPVMLILLVSVVALYPAPWLPSAHAVQTTWPTFSRSWYIETSVDTRFVDIPALAQQDVQWTVSSQQCSRSKYASFVLLD